MPAISEDYQGLFSAYNELYTLFTNISSLWIWNDFQQALAVLRRNNIPFTGIGRCEFNFISWWDTYKHDPSNQVDVRRLRVFTSMALEIMAKAREDRRHACQAQIAYLGKIRKDLVISNTDVDPQILQAIAIVVAKLESIKTLLDQPQEKFVFDSEPTTENMASTILAIYNRICSSFTSWIEIMDNACKSHLQTIEERYWDMPEWFDARDQFALDFMNHNTLNFSFVVEMEQVLSVYIREIGVEMNRMAVKLFDNVENPEEIPRSLTITSPLFKLGKCSTKLCERSTMIMLSCVPTASKFATPDCEKSNHIRKK